MSRAVIDQPGIRVFAAGLLISLVLGLLVRSQISNERVSMALEKSTRVLEKDFLIDFDEAQVKLTKWSLPWPHLVISHIRLSPKKLTCQSSQIFIDQLEIPLNLQTVFFAEPFVDTVRAQNVEVRIAQVADCLTPKTKVKSNVSEKEMAAQIESIKPAPLFLQKTKDQLKEVSIDQLKIITQKNSEQPLLFKQLHLYLSYENFFLTQLEIKSKIFALKDQRADLYFLVGDLKALIKPDQFKNIDAILDIKSKVLDGDMQVFIDAHSKNRQVAFEVVAQKISLKALSIFQTSFQKKSEKNFAFERWPLAVNLSIVGRCDFMGEPQFDIKFKNLNAKGENMLLEASEIQAESVNNQIGLKPFTVNFKNISLSPLKYGFSRQAELQSIESLGSLSGQFNYQTEKLWSFEGLIEHVDLIFSNRGTRELQSIDSAQIAVQQKNKNITAQVSQFVINSEPVQGLFEGSYFSENESIQAKLNLEGNLLKEKIWKQLTDVTQTVPVKLNWSYKKGVDERHQIRLTAPRIDFAGMGLLDPQIDFLQLSNEQTKTLALTLKIPKSVIKVNELPPTLRKTFFNESTAMNATDYSAQKIQATLQGPDWKNMTFDFDASLLSTEDQKTFGHLKAQGEWRSDNTLSAKAQLQNLQKQFRYEIVRNEKDQISFLPEKKE